MKQILTILFLLVAFSAFGQFEKTTGVKVYTATLPSVPDSTSNVAAEVFLRTWDGRMYVYDRSTNVIRLDVQITQGAGDPSVNPGSGPKTYINTTDGSIHRWTGSAWVELISTATDDQTLTEVLGQGNSAGGSKITNLGTPTAGADAATKAYVDNRTLNFITATQLADSLSSARIDSAYIRNDSIFVSENGTEYFTGKNDSGGGTDDQTAAEIKSALETLSGTDRLDITAIKNVPEGVTIGSETVNEIKFSYQKTVISDQLYYNAFPHLDYNDSTKVLIAGYFEGKQHASASRPVYIRSFDEGRTWTDPTGFESRITGMSWKGPVISRLSDRWIAIYEHGTENTNGHAANKSFVRFSTNDGETWTTKDTIDLSSIFAYRASIQAGSVAQIPSTDTIIVSVYGLDAVGTNFEAGVLRTGDYFNSFEYVPFPQDSSVHKFNETGLVYQGDTLLAFIRSELNGSGTLYRSFSLDDGLTWSTPVSVLTKRPTKPDVSVWSNGTYMLTQRLTADADPAFFTSTDNGITWIQRGRMLPYGKPFLYSQTKIIADRAYIIYSNEPHLPAISGTEAAINFGYINGIEKVTESGNSIVTPLQDLPVDNSPLVFSIDRDGERYVRSIEEKTPISIGVSTTTTDDRVNLVFGEDVTTAGGKSILKGAPNSGYRQTLAPMSSVGQGAPSFRGRVESPDSLYLFGEFQAACTDGRYIWMAPVSGTGKVKKYNVLTKELDSITVSGLTYSDLDIVGDQVYTLSGSTTTVYKINKNTNATSTFTLNQSGYSAMEYAAGYLWVVGTGRDSLLKLNPATDTWQSYKLPEGGYGSIIWTGKDLLITGYTTKAPVLFNPATEVFTYEQELITGVTGVRLSSCWDGSRVWVSNATSNTIFSYNPYTKIVKNVTLPAGKYPDVKFDGFSVWAIPREGQLQKINPVTLEVTSVAVPNGDTATDKYYSSVIADNKLFLVGYKNNVLASVAIPERPAGLSGEIVRMRESLAAKAPLASPALTGTPTAPTATTGTNTTQLATTAFVETAVSELDLSTHVPTDGDTLTITTKENFVLQQGSIDATVSIYLDGSAATGTKVYIKYTDMTTYTLNTTSGNFIAAGSGTGTATLSPTGTGEIILLKHGTTWYQLK